MILGYAIVLALLAVAAWTKYEERWVSLGFFALSLVAAVAYQVLP